MKNRTLLLSAITFLFLNTSIVIARCCSHSIVNKSGKFISTVYFYPSGLHHIREEWNIHPNQTKTFTTDQSNNGQGTSAIMKVKVQPQSGSAVWSYGNWPGNRNFTIHPDLTVTA